MPARTSLLACLSCSLLAAACGSPPKEATFPEIKAIFARSCNFSACHQSALPQYGNLKLSEPDAYCALTGPREGATFRPSAQADYPRRVVPGDRARSFLYRKLTLSSQESGPQQPLGSRMPLGAALEAAEIDLFGRWIDAGAPNEAQPARPCS